MKPGNLKIDVETANDQNGVQTNRQPSKGSAMCKDLLSFCQIKTPNRGNNKSQHWLESPGNVKLNVPSTTRH